MSDDSNNDHLNRLLEEENVYTMDDDDDDDADAMIHERGKENGSVVSDAGGGGGGGQNTVVAEENKTTGIEADDKHQTQQRLMELMQKRERLERFKQQAVAENTALNENQGTELAKAPASPLSAEDFNTIEARKLQSNTTESNGDHNTNSHINKDLQKQTEDHHHGLEKVTKNVDKTENGSQEDLNSGIRFQASHGSSYRNDTYNDGHASREGSERRNWEKGEDNTRRRNPATLASPNARSPHADHPQQHQRHENYPPPHESGQNEIIPHSRSRQKSSLQHYQNHISREIASTYYFITKVYDNRDLKIAQDLGIWTVFKTEITNVNLAVEGGEAILIFQLPKENRYFGYAQVTNQIAHTDHRKNVKWFDTQEKKSRNFPIQFKATDDFTNYQATFRDTGHLRDIDGTPVNNVKNGRQIPYEAGKFICDLFRGEGDTFSTPRRQYQGPPLSSRSHVREQRYGSESYDNQTHRHRQYHYRTRDEYPTEYPHRHLSPPASYDNAPSSTHHHHHYSPQPHLIPPNDHGFQRSRYGHDDRYRSYYDANPHGAPPHAWNSYGGGEGDMSYHSDHPRRQHAPPLHPQLQHQQQFYDRASSPKRRAMYEDDGYSHYPQPAAPHMPYEAQKNHHHHHQHHHQYQHPYNDDTSYFNAPLAHQSSHRLAHPDRNHYDDRYAQQQQQQDPMHSTSAQAYTLPVRDHGISMSDGYREQQYNNSQYRNRYTTSGDNVDTRPGQQSGEGYDDSDFSRDSKRRRR